jgi:hypothetical protein
VSGNENDGQFGPFEADPALQIETVHPWHPNVCNQTTRRRKNISMQEVICEGECPRFHAGGFDEALQ